MDKYDKGGDKLVAEWVANDLLEHFKPLYYPDKPVALTNYEAMSNEGERKKWDMEHPTWRRDTGTETYEKQHRTAVLENYSNIHHLAKWAELLKDDALRHSKLITKLKEFNNAPTIRLTASAKEAQEDVRVQTAKDIFKGDIEDL